MACGPTGPTFMGDHPAAKGFAALRRGDVAEALTHFEALIAAEPNGVPGHFLRVEALDRLGRREEARLALVELIARFPFAEGACRERLALLALRDANAELALAELAKASGAGWTNADAIRHDEAFAPFAADERFAPLFAAADRNAER